MKLEDRDTLDEIIGKLSVIFDYWASLNGNNMSKYSAYGMYFILDECVNQLAKIEGLDKVEAKLSFILDYVSLIENGQVANGVPFGLQLLINNCVDQLKEAAK